jgi:hypothetical protein
MGPFFILFFGFLPQNASMVVKTTVISLPFVSLPNVVFKKDLRRKKRTIGPKPNNLNMTIFKLNTRK